MSKKKNEKGVRNVAQCKGLGFKPQYKQKQKQKNHKPTNQINMYNISAQEPESRGEKENSWAGCSGVVRVGDRAQAAEAAPALVTGDRPLFLC